MKKLTALTTIAVLTISLGTAAFAMSTDSIIDIKDKAKEVPSITLKKVDSNDNLNNTTNNSNASADNFNQMIELEKIRLQQAIDNGIITPEQAKIWKRDIKQMEENGQSIMSQNDNIVTSERFNQMIELEKDRLQQGIDSGMISKAHADLWQSQINLMEKNYDNNNYNINDICPTSYGHDVMWDNNYNLSNNNNLPTTSKTQNRSNSIQQSSYKASAKQNTNTTMVKPNNVSRNNSVNSQNTRWNNMSNRNFNGCNDNYNNWNH